MFLNGRCVELRPTVPLSPLVYALRSWIQKLKIHTGNPNTQIPKNIVNVILSDSKCRFKNSENADFENLKPWEKNIQQAFFAPLLSNRNAIAAYNKAMWRYIFEESKTSVMKEFVENLKRSEKPSLMNLFKRRADDFFQHRAEKFNELEPSKLFPELDGVPKILIRSKNKYNEIKNMLVNSNLPVVFLNKSEFDSDAFYRSSQVLSIIENTTETILSETKTSVTKKRFYQLNLHGSRCIGGQCGSYFHEIMNAVISMSPCILLLKDITFKLVRNGAAGGDFAAATQLLKYIHRELSKANCLDKVGIINVIDGEEVLPLHYEKIESACRNPMDHEDVVFEGPPIPDSYFGMEDFENFFDMKINLES